MSSKFIKKGAGFGETAYDAAATFGRVVAFLKMLLGIIIGIVLTVIGVVLIRQKDTYVKTTGKVREPKCQTLTEKDSKGRSTQRVECTSKIEYTVNSKNYSGSLILNYSVAEGQTVDIQYNPENPNDIRQPQVKPKTVGIILIVIGLVIMFGTVIWFILALRYKVVAAGTGAATAVSWTASALTPSSNSDW